MLKVLIFDQNGEQSKVKNKIRLVPYKQQYVKQYNKWFQDQPLLLQLTGSDPLTVDQQYQNQKDWISNPTKYIFIIFDKQHQTMIGDVNLFFSEWIEPHQMEINVMIAKKQFRGRGIAGQILQAVECFGNAIYGKKEIIAKIKANNQSSLKLFKKNGYEIINFNQHFQQHQLRKVNKCSQEEDFIKLNNQYHLKVSSGQLN